MVYFELLQLNYSNNSNLMELVEILVQDPTLFADFTPFFINSIADYSGEISWTREDLFIWATFAGDAIDLRCHFFLGFYDSFHISMELTEWNDPLLGNCFSFGQSGELYDIADIGENYGFQALLNTNESELLPWIGSE